MKHYYALLNALEGLLNSVLREDDEQHDSHGLDPSENEDSDLSEEEDTMPVSRVLEHSDITEYIKKFICPTVLTKISNVNRWAYTSLKPTTDTFNWLRTECNSGFVYDNRLRFHAAPSAFGTKDWNIWRVMITDLGNVEQDTPVRFKGFLVLDSDSAVIVVTEQHQYGSYERLYGTDPVDRGKTGTSVNIVKLAVVGLKESIGNFKWGTNLDFGQQFFFLEYLFPGEDQSVIHHTPPNGELHDWLLGFYRYGQRRGRRHRMQSFFDSNGLWQLRDGGVGSDGWHGVCKIDDNNCAWVWVQGSRTVSHENALEGFNNRRPWEYTRSVRDIRDLNTLKSVLSKKGRGILNFKTSRAMETDFPLEFFPE